MTDALGRTDVVEEGGRERGEVVCINVRVLGEGCVMVGSVLTGEQTWLVQDMGEAVVLDGIFEREILI